MKYRSIKFITLLLGLAISLTVQAQVAVAPRILQYGVSSRYSPVPVSSVLKADFVSQSFQDVIRSKYVRNVASVGLDETMYFRLRSEGFGTKRMLRLRNGSRAQSIGLYAEMRLGHTDGWTPVAKRNAPQHDLFKYENGQRIFAQVKTHRNGKPGTYVLDMRKDNMSSRFLIPDDHYEPTLQHLRRGEEKARATGSSKTAAFYERQAQRLGKVGATYSQLDAEAQLSAKLARNRIIAARVGWVVSGVMILPSVYMNYDAYYTGEITGNEFSYNLGKDVLAVGAGLGGAALGNTFFKTSPLGVGGLAALGALLVQEGFLIMKYGSFEGAFAQPQFWIVTGGNITAAGLGVAGAIYGGQFGAYIGSCGGPGGAVCGAVVGGVVVGGAGAVVGSFGGSQITRNILELCAPDWVYARYDERINTHLSELKECCHAGRAAVTQ